MPFLSIRALRDLLIQKYDQPQQASEGLSEKQEDIEMFEQQQQKEENITEITRARIKK